MLQTWDIELFQKDMCDCIKLWTANINHIYNILLKIWPTTIMKFKKIVTIFSTSKWKNTALY